MIRIRFHGRGGHGVKTAGRIVGTAAFLAGHQVQDSPVYGAERRGAAVTAFTRISDTPIRERGLIDSPDLIVIADETLLNDRGAAVLAGQESASVVFVNAASSDGMVEKYGIKPTLVTFDVTALTLETLGKASALSAGLAGAAARLTGLISVEQLIEAVREELTQLHATQGLIEQNVTIAMRVFGELGGWALLPDRSSKTTDGQEYTSSTHAIQYVPPIIGTASILAPGNAAQRNTGTWRVERPEIDRDVCSRCQLCVLGCPDGAMSLDEHGFPVIDYDHCKGCMICAQLCPLKAIGRTKEVRAW
jgi:pyruvate ferredoxin oxidoreductase gamma subunit